MNLYHTYLVDSEHLLSVILQTDQGYENTNMVVSAGPLILSF